MCIDAQNLADFYETALLNSLMGSYLNGGSLSEQDLQEGSTFINNLPNVNVPILCFAAEEDRWALARLAFTATHNDELQTDPNINANGTFDQTGYDLMLAGVGGCYVVGGYHASVAAGLALAGVTDPVLWYLSALNAIASYNWFATADYLDNGLDYDHGVLVGNCYYEPHSYCYTGLVCQDTPPPPPIEEVGGMKRVTAPVCTLVPGTICTSWTVAVPIGNDGVVSTYAQTLKPNQGSNVIIPSATIKGVNHMEEFNHPNTRAEFNNAIVLGGYGNGVFKK